ncbi:MAG TPA: hypothetical protein EYO33_11295 [Phycisphaerales bacterium]|nr:hypothetical protein [Phycisphaerales bacterium]
MTKRPFLITALTLSLLLQGLAQDSSSAGFQSPSGGIQSGGAAPPVSKPARAQVIKQPVNRLHITTRQVESERKEEVHGPRCGCPKHRRGRARNRQPYAPTVIYNAPYAAPPYSWGVGATMPNVLLPHAPPVIYLPPPPPPAPVRYRAPAPVEAEAHVRETPAEEHRPSRLAINHRLSLALDDYSQANGVGGQLLLKSRKQSWLVRYTGRPKFDDYSVLVPALARKSGEDVEIPVTFKLTVDPETFQVVGVNLLP